MLFATQYKFRLKFPVFSSSFVFSPEEVCVNPMISYTDSCNCSDSSDIELNDEWVGKKSPKLSRGSRSRKLCLAQTKHEMGEGALNSTSMKGSHCLRPKLRFPSKCNNKTWRTPSVSNNVQGSISVL